MLRAVQQIVVGLIVANKNQNRAPTDGTDGGKGGAVAPPGYLRLVLKITQPKSQPRASSARAAAVVG
jgi:hypothetical protein